MLVLRRQLMLLLASVVLASPLAAAEMKTVAVTAIVEHPALDAARDGIKDELAAAGYEDGKNLDLRLRERPGQPGDGGADRAQARRRGAGRDRADLDALGAGGGGGDQGHPGGVHGRDRSARRQAGRRASSSPGGNVTGMSDLSPIGKHLDLIKEIMPAAQDARRDLQSRRGQLGDAAGAAARRRRRRAGSTIAEAPAPKSSDVLPAAQSLVGKVDAIYVPTDNTVVTALEAIVQVGTQNQLPVFAGDTDSVPRGAIAALGFNY